MFNAEYPMVRWLERNGYDVSYFTGVDSDRRGDEILEHKSFLSVGHDEYWSGGQRDNVEAARADGVNLAFFSGNEVFWKTRWEDNHRTLVSYKETHANQTHRREDRPDADLDRDVARPALQPARRRRPARERAHRHDLHGQQRHHRDRGAGGRRQDALLAQHERRRPRAGRRRRRCPTNTLGYEWDEDLDNGSRPPGLVRMSSTTEDVPQRILDHGSNYGPGTATHHLTLYRHQSGALVFGAGTIQWPWGLDGNHDRGGSTARPAHAAGDGRTCFADMGAQPDTLPGRSRARDGVNRRRSPQLADRLAAWTARTSRAAKRRRSAATATDAGGGEVGGVEVSVDGGNTWHPADGRAELDLLVDAGRDRQHDDQDAGGRRQRQPREPRRGGDRQRRAAEPARARSGTTR